MELLTVGYQQHVELSQTLQNLYPELTVDEHLRSTTIERV